MQYCRCGLAVVCKERVKRASLTLKQSISTRGGVDNRLTFDETEHDGGRSLWAKQLQLRLCSRLRYPDLDVERALAATRGSIK